jgi:hypothetical protein
MKKIVDVKKCFIFIITGIFLCVFLLPCSCNTTGKIAQTAIKKNAAEESAASQEKKSEPHSVNGTRKNVSLSAENEFKNKISGIDFSVASAPKRTTKNVAFASPYTIHVKDSSGCGIPDFPVTVSWPISRTDDSIVYETKIQSTNKDGSLVFTPEVPKYSFDDKITFYPAPVSSEPSILQAAYAAGISAPYKVRTNYAKKPGVIYVFDFNESGKAGTNSQYLLREFINSGVRIGNSPIATSNYLSKPIESLYKATYNIVGNAYAFMICGSIKYVKPVETNDDGKYVCQLEADISCINMKDGSVIYSTHQTESVAADSKYKAVDTCRNSLAAKTAHAVLFGM